MRGFRPSIGEGADVIVADAKKEPAMAIYLYPGQIALLLALALLTVAALTFWAAWHYFHATHYALDRREYVCTAVKKNAGNSPALWRGAYYFPTESDREDKCLEYSRAPKNPA